MDGLLTTIALEILIGATAVVALLLAGGAGG
jgi:hypothetical protein